MPIAHSCLVRSLLGLASHLEQCARELASLGGTQAVALTIDAYRVPEVPSFIDLLSLIESNMHLDWDGVVIAVLGRQYDFWPFVPEVIHPVQQPVPKMAVAGDAPRRAWLVVAPAVGL